jgi:hypothetical protein
MKAQRLHLFSGSVAIVAGLVVSAPCLAQVWNYTAYTTEQQQRVPGTLTLIHDREQHYVQLLIGNNPDPCFNGKARAIVSNADNHLLIEVPPLMTGCTAVRFVIHKDGSGGHRELLMDGSWVPDRLDRGLNPKGERPPILRAG